MFLSRRQFLGTALTASAAPLLMAQPEPLWGGPVLDIHFHYRSQPGANIKHLDGAGVTRAVLLTRAADDDGAKAEMQAHPDRFVRFTSANITKPEGFDQMKKCIQTGAIGFGEIKFHVALDGPEMRRLYDLAAEMNAPVLIHFAEAEQFPGEGTFSTGYTRLPGILKAYSKTTFIGHGDNFWANVSAEVPPNTPYPTGKIKPGGLSDKMLSDYANFYGDMSANSGRNALARDPEFMTGFLQRHRTKLMFGCDCSCIDGHGTGQRSTQPLIKGKCVARETLTALKQMTSPELFRAITWNNGTKLLKIVT